MEGTVESVIQTFEDACDKERKLFIPNLNQDGIAKNLAKHFGRYYSLDLLEACIYEYVRTATEPVLVYNFALEAHHVRERIMERQEEDSYIRDLMKATGERMHQFES